MGTGPRVAAGTITLDLNQAEQVFFPLMDLNVGVLLGFLLLLLNTEEKSTLSEHSTSLKSGNSHEPSTPINECK